MTYLEFEQTVNELFAFFRLKTFPEKAEIQIWYRDISKIPAPALSHVVSFIKDKDSLPRNLVKAYLGGWMDYKHNNPDKIISERVDCSDCGGRGMHWAKKGAYSYVQPCTCANSYRHFGSGIPRMSRSQLTFEGFEVEEPRPIGDEVRKMMDLSQLNQQVGRGYGERGWD